MKKLISMLAALAVVTTGTAAFATDFTVETKNAEGETVTSTMAATDAETQATYEADEDGLYTVDLASVAGTQDQTTILAVEGKTIKVGSIKYINQSATQSFTFGMDEPADTVYVLAGGSAINPTLVGSIEKEEVSTGATVSGVVENFVAQEFYDELLLPIVDEIFEGEGAEEFVAAYTAKAYLVDMETIEEFIAYYLGEADEFTYVAEADVSAVDGSFSFAEVADGTYALIITKDGALPYMEYAIVEGEDVDAGAINLINGDLIGTKDYLIDSGDLGAMVDALGEIGADNFVAAFDIAADCLIDSGDLGEAVANLGDISAYDTELIAELFS